MLLWISFISVANQKKINTMGRSLNINCLFLFSHWFLGDEVLAVSSQREKCEQHLLQEDGKFYAIDFCFSIV